MLEIKDEHYITEFSKENKAVLSCKDGDTVIFNTRDCFNGALKSEEDRGREDDEAANPACGPLYVEGLKEGDVLAVDILDIEVGERGVICTIEDCGLLWKTSELRTRFLDIRENKTVFNGIDLDIMPMIGVIGLAPKDGEISTEDSFHLGGNMDCPLLNKGTTIYLPCEIDGGLLAIGDLHALMGDGEIAGTGIEIKGKVTVRVRIIKDLNISWPLLETEDAYYVNCNGIDANMAIERCYLEMQRLIASAMGWDLSDATLYLSLRGILSANQCCLSEGIDHEESGPNFRLGCHKKDIKLIR